MTEQLRVDASIGQAVSSMIGVLCKESERPLASEFFELFKVPWEQYRQGQRYQAVICSDLEAWERERPTETLLLVFSSSLGAIDRELGIQEGHRRSGCFLVAGGSAFPLYGSVTELKADGDRGTFEPLATIVGVPEKAGLRVRGETSTILRLGYDLFTEMRKLLTEGQPPENASFPTLDLHIDRLRTWLVEEGVTVIEVPPTPYGCQFIACLTHDVDFAAIRDHLLDRAFFGFLYRASLGSFLKLLRGDMTFRQLVRNLLSIASLPLVYLGLVKDFWNPFDKYVEIEGGESSTFFIIPFKNRDGEKVTASSKARRRTRYDCDDVEAALHGLLERGKEIGVHGIDAWHDAARGATELARLRRITNQERPGVRIHWLLFDQRSWGTLEEAGFRYDSTFGYNDAVGFRAGTMRAYVPPGASKILELPLIIQDTALFYGGRMNLGRVEAAERCAEVLAHARRLGGAVTVLWHDRSMAPERQWEWLYEDLLRDFRSGRVWVTSAEKAVKWFEARRSLRFTSVDISEDQAVVRLSLKDAAERAVQLRVFPGGRTGGEPGPRSSPIPRESGAEQTVVVMVREREGQQERTCASE